MDWMRTMLDNQDLFMRLETSGLVDSFGTDAKGIFVVLRSEEVRRKVEEIMMEAEVPYRIQGPEDAK